VRVASDITFDRRMTDAEALMWRLEKDPYLSSTFANVSILDRAPDFDRLRRRMERATVAIPRLRQRVQSAPANLSSPMWIDDPDFDIDFHLRRVALPAPGSMRQLLDLVSLLVADPFDRTRPLWQFVVIEGLPDGRAALVEKLHHTIADGEGTVQLSLQFFDFERDAPEPAPLERDPVEHELDRSLVHNEMWRDMLAGSFRLPLALVRQIRDLVADPASIPSQGASTLDSLRTVLGQLTDVESARSPIWIDRSTRRHAEVLRVPFIDVRDAARRLGGTLNTALLSAASDAAGRYHRECGAPVDELRASMAISTRSRDSGSDAANAFSLARFVVPTVEMSAADRFVEVATRSSAAASDPAVGSLSTIASLASSLPTAVLTRVARMQSQTVDFATSNVKGTPIPVFVAGSEILHNFPFGPLAGVAFNLTLLSHVGSLDMGVNIDTAAVSRPQLLHDLLADSFDDLIAAQPRKATTRSPKKKSAKPSQKKPPAKPTT
jgi:WS/DGAT/MGAT family acyltransferase